MAHIRANNVSIHYPVSSRAVAVRQPKNLAQVGKKNYILALDRINLEVKNGQRIGLVGSNGCGKSTLLRVLGGLYAPTGGDLKISGRVSSLFNLNLGVQADASGRENIFVRGIVKGWTYRQVRSEFDSIVKFAELADVIDLPIRTYSDGMRMRLLFAIATAFSPEILLLDEWIGAGDSKFQQKAAARMNSLVDNAGITVMASHNRNLIQSICDQAIWLDAGRICAQGPVSDVYAAMDEHSLKERRARA